MISQEALSRNLKCVDFELSEVRQLQKLVLVQDELSESLVDRIQRNDGWRGGTGNRFYFSDDEIEELQYFLNRIQQVELSGKLPRLTFLEKFLLRLVRINKIYFLAHMYFEGARLNLRDEFRQLKIHNQMFGADINLFNTDEFQINKEEFLIFNNLEKYNIRVRREISRDQLHEADKIIETLHEYSAIIDNYYKKIKDILARCLEIAENNALRSYLGARHILPPEVGMMRTLQADPNVIYTHNQKSLRAVTSENLNLGLDVHHRSIKEIKRFIKRIEYWKSDFLSFIFRRYASLCGIYILDEEHKKILLWMQENWGHIDYVVYCAAQSEIAKKGLKKISDNLALNEYYRSLQYYLLQAFSAAPVIASGKVELCQDGTINQIFSAIEGIASCTPCISSVAFLVTILKKIYQYINNTILIEKARRIARLTASCTEFSIEHLCEYTARGVCLYTNTQYAIELLANQYELTDCSYKSAIEKLAKRDITCLIDHIINPSFFRKHEKLSDDLIMAILTRNYENGQLSLAGIN